MSSLLSGHTNIGAILGAIKSSTKPVHVDLHRPERAAPFITVSREAGAGAPAMAEALVAMLKERDRTTWQVYDRALVEKVAADHRIDRSLVEAVEESSHSWLKDMLAGVAGPASQPDVDEMKIVRRVSVTIRGIAQVGHAIIVGRGGVFVTANMPGGIHVRLIAPLEHRIRRFAQVRGLSLDAARDEVLRIEENRAAFYRLYWPSRALDVHSFTMTLNTAGLTDQQVAQAVLPIVPR